MVFAVSLGWAKGWALFEGGSCVPPLLLLLLLPLTFVTQEEGVETKTL
jgi:hypothetical protein